MLEIFTQYFWPFSIPGIKNISQEGIEIQIAKLESFRKGKEYTGPRESIFEQEDKRAREHNRERLFPYMKTYIK